MTEIITDIYSVKLTRPSVMTIGSFDGVHRGHQHLLAAVISSAHARSVASVAIVLNPHPKLVLRPDSPLLLLSTLKERLALLGQLGLDYVVVFPFTLEHSKIPARDFVKMLIDHLQMVEIQCGPNFALGYKREGDVAYLRELGKEFGFAITVVAPRQYVEGIISSTCVRAAITDGDISTATALLGRFPSLCSVVVHGDHRGRQLGFPTANLNVPDKKLIPANGIYAVRVCLNDEWFNGAANVGIRPQFGGGPRLVEVYILDFDREIYGQDLKVDFVARLREEKKFESVGELIAQMTQDVAASRKILEGTQQPPDETI